LSHQNKPHGPARHLEQVADELPLQYPDRFGKGAGVNGVNHLGGQGEHPKDNRAGQEQEDLDLLVDHLVGGVAFPGNRGQSGIKVLSHGIQDKAQVKHGDAPRRLEVSRSGQTQCAGNDNPYH